MPLAGKVVRELAPFRDRHEDVEACCRQFGLRMKRSGTRRAERGANAMLALKGCVMKTGRKVNGMSFPDIV